MSDKSTPENTPSNAKPEIWLRVKEKWQSLPDIVRERTILLGGAVIAGAFLAKIFKKPIEWWLGASSKDSVSIEIGILLMSLPVLYVLWQFRTTDTQEQIQETRENAKAARDGVEATRDALNADTLGRYLSMLFSKELSARCVGLIGLAEIRRQGKFVEEIDSATRQGIDLNGALLEGENLSGLKLDGAFLNEVKFYEVDLSGASLRFARFDGATLSNAILKGANLRFANFKGADLIGADLSNAQLQNANLEDLEMTGTIRSLAGAIYNGSTKLPGWIDPKQEGMKEEIDPNRLT